MNRIQKWISSRRARRVPQAREIAQVEGFVVLLSHMRSGSTLLSHLLTESPEILGEGEQLLNYAFAPTMHGKEIATFLRGRPPLDPRVRFLYDKILHDVFGLPFREGLPAKYLFLVREPAASLESIQRLLRADGMPRDAASLYASRYLLARLHFLSGYAQGFNDRGIAYRRLSYEDLLAYSPEMLAGMRDFLGLREPLSVNYSVRDWTGQRGKGDPGSKIRLGRIDPSVNRGLSVDLTVFDGLQPEIIAAYERFLETTREHALAPPTDR